MGGRDRTISNRDILGRMIEAEDPAFFTSEIRDMIGFSSNSGTLDRLRELEDLGHVASRQPPESDSRAPNIWWVTDEGRAFLEQED